MYIASNREDGGKLVRQAWIEWANKLQNPKPSWLVPWEQLPERDKEADRCIWDAITAPYHHEIATLQDELQRSRDENNRWRDEKLKRDLNS